MSGFQHIYTYTHIQSYLQRSSPATYVSASKMKISIQEFRSQDSEFRMFLVRHCEERSDAAVYACVHAKNIDCHAPPIGGARKTREIMSREL